ncbi:hypothetical protein L218DRAFT_948292 [Marasmius fiardii PR-910]|nr:hypothetical protein L218DRAFT_948292 [Marasmius fiardii PR-910]
MSSTSFDPARLTHSLQLGYIEVASLTLLLWDYLLTLPQETDLIWSRPKRWSTLLFYLVTNTIPYVNEWLNYVLYCAKDTLDTALTAEYFNSLRGSSSISKIGSDFLQAISDPAPGVRRCTVVTEYHVLWLFWIGILVYEATVMTLVVWQFYKYLKDRKKQKAESLLIELILKHTMFYLLLVFVMFIANTIIASLADPTLPAMLTPLTKTILSILGNRILFSLRREIEIDTGGTSFTTTLETWNAVRDAESMTTTTGL